MDTYTCLVDTSVMSRIFKINSSVFELNNMGKHGLRDFSLLRFNLIARFKNIISTKIIVQLS